MNKVMNKIKNRLKQLDDDWCIEGHAQHIRGALFKKFKSIVAELSYEELIKVTSGKIVLTIECEINE